MPLRLVCARRDVAVVVAALLLTVVSRNVFAQAVTGVTLASSLAAPQVAGTTIAWTANPSGGVSPLYRWMVSPDNGGTWTIVREWATSSVASYYDVFQWTPPTANSQYRVGVWVKSTGSSTSSFEASNAVTFSITEAPPVPGQIAKFASTSGALANSVLTEANGNIGVGTTAPGQKLDVNGNGRVQGIVTVGSGAGAGILTYNSGNFFVRAESGRALSLGSSGNPDRLVIGTSGNVGVGTATPGYRFDVQGGQLNASGGLCIAGDCRTSWGQVGGGGGGSSGWASSGGNTSFTGGYVGIGTAGPQAHLHVSGNVIVAGTSMLGSATAGALLVRSGGATVGVLRPAVQNGSLLISDDSELATRGLTLANLGNVGIGTASPEAKLHVAGNVIVDGNIGAKYQDVAEWVEADTAIGAGTVVIADPDVDNHVRTSTAAYDTAIAGVVSAQPGVLLGEAGPGKVAVAQSGRVLVKVDASYGPIKRGDLLVASSTPGHAMRSHAVTLGGVPMHRPGTILGKALGNLDNGQGEVLALLTLQ